MVPCPIANTTVKRMSGRSATAPPARRPNTLLSVADTARAPRVDQCVRSQLGDLAQGPTGPPLRGQATTMMRKNRVEIAVS